MIDARACMYMRGGVVVVVVVDNTLDYNTGTMLLSCGVTVPCPALRHTNRARGMI